MEDEPYNPLCSHVDIDPRGPNNPGLESSQILTVQAVTVIQKTYRSYSTRRKLADSAVILELWWQALDFVRSYQSTVSFLDIASPESYICRWNQLSLTASKVGQGSSKDAKAALILAFQHWIEAVDPRHRYGHNLRIYFEKWSESTACQRFFYWLDIGDGRNVDLPECPRSSLRKQLVKYLGPQERKHFEYIVSEGKIVHKQTGDLLDTNTDGSKGSKWIFVMSTSYKLYAGKKMKGMFHHSSFLAGGATIAAGRFTVENGILKTIEAYSGHYKPSAENISNFLTFLRENGVDFDRVEVGLSSDEDDCREPKNDRNDNAEKVAETIELREPSTKTLITTNNTEPEPRAVYRKTLSGGLQSPNVEVPQNVILERIKSRGKSRSYQLGNQLMRSWSTGAGPRIVCVADYPMELRKEALEFVNLSHKGGRYDFNLSWICKLLKAIFAILIPVLAYWLYS